ncbi:synaptophysin-like [Cuculus canorus]|uniref:synaptophysin-like n=1 Tax=Cuculus canorus TaxID=55661 RepID=UPI0023AB07A0|nr:synaptophysin-like [Cuculus canorus]
MAATKAARTQDGAAARTQNGAAPTVKAPVPTSKMAPPHPTWRGPPKHGVSPVKMAPSPFPNMVSSALFASSAALRMRRCSLRLLKSRLFRYLVAPLPKLVAGGQFRVIKEPLGFLKLLEWLFSIFAFATCGGYSGSFRLSVECPPPNRSAPLIPVTFGYPFRAPLSSSSRRRRLFPLRPAALGGTSSWGGPSAPVPEPPRIDFAVTALLAFLWLVASCAWAAALGEVKAATAPTAVLAQLEGCRRPGARCRALAEPRFSGLNTSVVFGFLNLVLWGGNLWFALKETGWGGFGAPRAAPQQPPPPEKAPEGGYGPPDGSYGGQGGGGGGYQPEYGGYQPDPPPFGNQM